MPLFDLTLSKVRAADMQEAEVVKNSLATILNKLQPHEVIELAELLKQKPGIVQKAKQFLHLL